MMRIIYITGMLFCLGSMRAQVQLPALPPDSVLFASLDSFYHHKQAVDLQPYTLARKWDWLSYMPSIGLTYALSTTPSGALRSRPVPTISIQATAIGNAIYRNKQRKAHSKHVIASVALDHHQDQIRLHKLLDQHRHAIYDLSLYQQVHQIQNQIDTIQKAQLDSLLIKPSDYLATQEAHLRQSILYQDKVSAIRDLYWEILALARYAPD